MHRKNVDRPASISDFRALGREHGADRARAMIQHTLDRHLKMIPGDDFAEHYEREVAQWFDRQEDRLRALGAGDEEISAYLKAANLALNRLLRDAGHTFEAGGINRTARRAAPKSGDSRRKYSSGSLC